MEKEKYRPGIAVVLIVFVVIGQIISTNYLKKDFEGQLQQCYEAINTNSIMNTALINLLVEKKIMEKGDVLIEAQKLSANLKTLVERMQNMSDEKSQAEKKSTQKE